MSSSNSRPMRKGTKSCLECRRRKARCIYSTNESTCIRCKSRGTSCVEQSEIALRDVPSTNTRITVSKLSSRVEELEAIIKATGGSHHDVSRVSDMHTQLDEVLDSPSKDVINPSTISIHDSTPHNTSVSSDIEPIPSLFDNAIWSRNPMEPKDEARAKKAIGEDLVSSQKRYDTIKQLRRILPGPEILSLVLEAAKFWWNTWRAIAPWVLESTPEKYTKLVGGFVVYSLSSEDPSLVSMGILCVAFSIQQLDSSHGDILQRLPGSQGKLFHALFSNVETLILNDSHYASSMTGIGVSVLAAKILMSLGLVKKAWLLLHRSISYGQLLRLQTPQHLQSESETDFTRRQHTWAYLCELDLYTSLLIGLPYAASGCTLRSDIRSKRGTTSWFQSRLLRLSAQIIDRNQAGLELSTSQTEDLQKEAALAAYDMDREFWDAPNELSLQNLNRLQYMENVTLQLWYHQIRVFIHMPLMIKSIENPLLEDHKIACLAGCREALRIYRIMRSDPLAAFSLEKLIDYQSFIYTTLLILGQFDLGPSSDSQTPRQYRDWELIDSTLEILRRASSTSNNAIAGQAVEGLEALASLARGSNARASQPSSLHVECKMNDCKVSVPFSGTITIFPGSLTKGLRNSSAQPSLSDQPVFTLSNSTYDSQQLPYNSVLEDDPGDGSKANGVPHIDFSWENLIEFNSEEDWSWLSDAGLYSV